MKLPRLDAVLAASLVSLATFTGCRDQPRPASESAQARELATPSQPDSGEPNLTVAPDGAVLLSWIEAAGDGAHALRHSRREAGGEWSAPRTVATGDDWFVNWADFPSLAALPDGTLLAHWLKKSGPAPFAYDVQLALSRDAGATWSEPLVPHRDGTQSEHGFVAMAPGASDLMGVVWLDGRNTVGDDDGPTDHGEGGDEMALMFASVNAAGRVGEETLLDPRVCDCCQTGMAPTDRGLLVVYRDRSESEVRDISYVRSDGEGWSEPRTLFADGWEIHGCPVNGPSVAARGSRVAVAWFTAPDDHGRVSVILSEDGGETWGAPVRVDEGEPIGRVQVALLAEHGALVSWLEQVEGGTHLKVRSLGSDGRLGRVLRVADSSTSRSSGFPRLAVSGREAVFAWRDSADPPRVRTAVLRLP
jgi:hypothetical protein